MVLVILLAVAIPQAGCMLKFWGKDDTPVEEQEFDVYGTVERIDSDTLTVTTRQGSQTFLFGPASVKGGELEPGQTVHVFFKREDPGSIITLVVRKID